MSMSKQLCWGNRYLPEKQARKLVSKLRPSRDGVARRKHASRTVLQISEALFITQTARRRVFERAVEAATLTTYRNLAALMLSVNMTYYDSI